MKSGPARVALLLGIASLRRPNQKRDGLFNPFLNPSISDKDNSLRRGLLARQNFGYFKCPLAFQLDTGRETLRARESCGVSRKYFLNPTNSLDM
jgi:hypothetical protein